MIKPFADLKNIQRDRIELIDEVLMACRISELPITIIMRNCNLATDNAKEIISLLVQNKLLESRPFGQTRTLYKTSDKGIEFIIVRNLMKKLTLQYLELSE